MGGRLGIFAVLLAVLWAAAGCATTGSVSKEERARRAAEEARMRAELLGRIHEAERDVWEQLDPLIRAAADYREEETHGYVGAVFVNERYYPEVLGREANAEGLGRQVTTLLVFPGSPAAEAGLRPGDRLISVNGVKVPKGGRGALFALKRVKRLLKPEEPNLLEVERGGEQLVLEVDADRGAFYGVIIVPSDEVDLHVDGDAIWVGLSLVEAMESEQDLAYLVAYALAKNVMRQPEQKGRNSFLGQIVDIAAAIHGVNTGGIFGSMGHKAYANSFEVEADLIALYLLASTGTAIDGYPLFWEEVLRGRDKNDELSVADQERLVMMQRVIDSIEAKRASGQPLFPEEYLSGDTSELELPLEGEAAEAEERR